MNSATQTAPAQSFDGFVGNSKPMDPGTNPHSPRYAYMPPVQSARSEARTTGYVFFNPGSLITFRTFSSGGWHNPEFYQNAKAATLTREFSAEMAAYNASILYASVEGHDVGFTLLPMLTGIPNANSYFEALHPSFAELGHQCPSGLVECPTCRMAWFESDGSSNYFENNSQGLDRNLAFKVKEALYNATVRYRDFAEMMWTEFADGYERTRNSQHPFTLKKEHHHYRKGLHLPDFQYSVHSTVPAAPIASAPIAGHGLTDAELAEIYAKRAAAQAGTAPKTTSGDIGSLGEKLGTSDDSTDAQSPASSEENGSLTETTPQEISDDSATAGAASPSDIGFEVGSIVMHGDSPVEVLEIKDRGWVTVKFTDSDETKTVRKGELTL